MEIILQSLRKHTLPPLTAVQQLCHNVSNILIQEPNLIRIDSPITIVGGIEGNFYDLLEILEECRDQHLLFLGNYSGYGDYGLQTLLLLLFLKASKPSNITLLRGNNQMDDQLYVSRLAKECLKKYGDRQLIYILRDVFDCLPITSIIEDKYLVIDMSILQSFQSLQQINLTMRTSRKKQDSQQGSTQSLTSQLTSKFIQKEQLKKIITNGNQSEKDDVVKIGVSGQSISILFIDAKGNVQGKTIKRAIDIGPFIKS